MKYIEISDEAKIINERLQRKKWRRDVYIGMSNVSLKNFFKKVWRLVSWSTVVKNFDDGRAELFTRLARTSDKQKGYGSVVTRLSITQKVGSSNPHPFKSAT